MALMEMSGCASVLKVVLSPVFVAVIHDSHRQSWEMIAAPGKSWEHLPDHPAPDSLGSWVAAVPLQEVV